MASTLQSTETVSFINVSYSKQTIHKWLLLYSLQRVSFIKGSYSTKTIYEPYLPLSILYREDSTVLFKPAYFVCRQHLFCVFCAFRRYFPLSLVYDPTCSTFLSLTKLKIWIFSQVVSSEKRGNSAGRYTIFAVLPRDGREYWNSKRGSHKHWGVENKKIPFKRHGLATWKSIA